MGNGISQARLWHQDSDILLQMASGKGPLQRTQRPHADPEVEKLFMTSFNATLDRYKVLPDLRDNVLAYYKNLNPSPPAKSTKKQKAEFTKLVDQLDRLKAVPEVVPAQQAP